MRYAMVFAGPISIFPIARVVQSKLLRLWFFRRRDWILKWNLRDRHAQGLAKSNLGSSLDTNRGRDVAFRRS